jgi:Holliday junction DNA helicase RuvA
LVNRELDSLTLDVNGVGYQVYSNPTTIASLTTDAEVELYVHTSVTDDAIRLYGFLSSEELAVFKQLISVERVGPKAAMSILGRGKLTTLVDAIGKGDSALLATTPGIGAKTAERLVLELKDKIGLISVTGKTGSGGGATTVAAIAVLVDMGFKEIEARRAVEEVSGSSDVSELVSQALRTLDKVKP